MYNAILHVVRNQPYLIPDDRGLILMLEYFKPPNIFTANDSSNWQETNQLVILRIG